MTINEMNEILNELADEMPQDFFKELNGGISLIPDVMYSPYDQGGDLYILAQYHRGGFMGRRITFNYGSIMRVYGRLSKDEIKIELRRILKHEFRHHLESLAGEKDLEYEDRDQIVSYLERYEDKSN